TDAAVNLTYDAAGRLTRLDDTQSGFISWTYDNANRMLSEMTPQGAVSYSYNEANQRISMTAADRLPVTYGYDSAGRLSSIMQGTELYTYGYDVLSRRVSLQRPNGVTTSYEWDQVDRLARLTHMNAPGTPLEDLRYRYSNDDEIAEITSLMSATTIPPSKNASVADAANRISQFGGESYEFDSLGQTTSKSNPQGRTQYQWDTRGRLTQAALPNEQQVSYSYDTLGRRTSRTVNGTTTSFLYDGDDVVLDRVGNSSIDYLHGIGTDEHLRQGPAGAGLYFLQDHLRSVIALTSAAGGI